jgi:hypothetical protein
LCGICAGEKHFSTGFGDLEKTGIKLHRSKVFWCKLKTEQRKINNLPSSHFQLAPSLRMRPRARRFNNCGKPIIAAIGAGEALFLDS